VKNNPELRNLKKTRNERKVTIREISKHLNISKSMYSYIENGDKRLSYDMAVNIASFFKTTPDALFKGDFKEFFKNDSHII